MQKQFNKNIWLMTVWLLWSCTALYANTYEPFAWNGPAEQPTYQFRSTSAYQPMTIGTSYTSQVSEPYASSPNKGPRKTEEWSWGNTDPEDDPVGHIPVGEPWVLLGMAILYMLIRSALLRRRNP